MSPPGLIRGDRLNQVFISLCRHERDSIRIRTGTCKSLAYLLIQGILHMRQLTDLLHSGQFGQSEPFAKILIRLRAIAPMKIVVAVHP